MKRALIAICVTAFVSTMLSAVGNAQQASEKKAVEDRQLNEYNKLIDRYFDSLNETDTNRRRELIMQVWAENGTFVSPFGKAKGYAAIDTQVQGVQKQFSNYKVRRTSKVDVLYDNYVRFNFEAAQPDGKVFIQGVDFGNIVDGKLHLLVGFAGFTPDSANRTQTSDEEAVKIPLENYIKAHATGNPEYARKAFHTEGNLIWIRDGRFAIESFDSFIKRAFTGTPAVDEEKRKDNRKIETIDVTGELSGGANRTGLSKRKVRRLYDTPEDKR